MYIPTLTALLLLLPLSVAATDITEKQANLLAPVAAQMKLKNYSSAAKLAAELPESGQRSYLLGITALKRGRSATAAELLGKAVSSYPLLADYAIYYQADAVRKTGNKAEAAVLLKALQKGFPDSPLVRRSLLLEADLLFETADFAAAEALYQKFIEKYPSGSDALQSAYRSALCREKRGDRTGAASVLRSLWLNSPASVQAARAENDISRLTSAGVLLQPYSAQELFKRASSLYDQRRYELVLATLQLINTANEKKDFSDRVRLKTGQSLLKAKHFQDAENRFKELSAADVSVEVRSEAAYLHARAIEKGGRDEDAFAAYNRVAAIFPDSAEADDALLDAAFIRKFQNRPREAAELFAKVLDAYPKTKLKQRIIWESGWANYLAGNFSSAAEQFKKLLAADDYRERALFWYGRSAGGAGDNPAAEESRSALRREFPFGFYTLLVQKSNPAQVLEEIPALTAELNELFPFPEGYERVKALISLGLIDDATVELSAGKKRLAKGKSDAGLARLYLEIDNYNGAMGLYNAAMLKRSAESRRAWSILYPKAFADLVLKYSEKAGVDPSLAYAVMRAESAFAPAATSPVGARGLMQLMPHTAAQVLHEKRLDPERLYDPELNIRLGTKHLRELIDKYGGNLTAVIASYNAGAHNVNRWLKTYSNLKNEEFIESIPFAETRDYVKKVLAVAALYKRLYGLK